VSTLENIFWHIIGYATMPVIFIIGFIGVAAGSLWLLSMTVDRD